MPVCRRARKYRRPGKTFRATNDFHPVFAGRKIFSQRITMRAGVQVEAGNMPVHVEHKAVLAVVVEADFQPRAGKMKYDGASGPAEALLAGYGRIDSPDE